MSDQNINLFSNSHPDSLSKLEGQIQRITYSNDETGFTVARVTVSGHSDPVTVVGNFGSLRPGQRLSMEGTWVSHPKFGLQFKVKRHETILPASTDAIVKYLGSGLIKGIGPIMAKRIVDVFGEKTLEVIDKNIEELAKIPGLGSKRIETIKEAWQDQKEISSIMVFLKAHGVGPALTTKIFKKYGHDAIPLITENPYRLAEEIHGVGFITADKLAINIGFEKESPERIEAGIIYVLEQMAEQGHVYYPYEELIKKSMRILGVDREVIEKGFGAVASKGKLIIEDLNQSIDDFEPNLKAIYLKRLHIAEVGTVRQIKRLMNSTPAGRHFDSVKAIQWVQKTISIRLTSAQLDAVKRALTEKFIIITGGPGTGKTTIIRAIIEIYKTAGFKIALAAPTGRASKRMEEATGMEAKTIHRLLEFNWQKGGFQRDERRPLEANIIIIDEASMIDISLMNRLLKAVQPEARVILVGDADQLPSVGPGNVLRDLIDSQFIGVVRLNKIFRQAEKSMIILNAHRINKGYFPLLLEDKTGSKDFYFIEQDDPNHVFNLVLELAARRIPKKFNMDPVKDIQVLTPMHKGLLGTENLNRGLQELINPEGAELKVGDRIFRVHDKVMQIRNDYEKEVFNGDIGIIQAVGENEIIVSYEDRPVAYKVHELEDLVHAYAISVHKSQGSEYRVVIFPVLPEHRILLQRNLIYTGVTRARDLLVMVGSKKALAAGIKTEKISSRYTYLANRLRELQ